MAQFRLPKNSKIAKGKVYDHAGNSKNRKTFKVYRWDRDSGENPRTDSYVIDLDKCGPMILDAIVYIKNEIDPSTVARLISKALKEKIEVNATDLNFLPKKAKLPI